MLVPFVAVHVPILLVRVIVGPLALFFAVVIFFKIADILVSRTAALAAAYVFAAYWPFLALLSYVSNEPLCVLLVAAATHRLVVWSRSHRRRDVVIAGVLLGYLTLVRVEFGYLLIAWIVIASITLLARQARDLARFALASSLIALLVCVPYLAYTQSVTNRFFYWSGSGAQQLYWMDTGRAQDYGDWWSTSEVESNAAFASLRPVFRRIEAHTPRDWDSKLMTVAVRNIENHPFLYLRNVAYNIGRLVVNEPYSNTPVRLRSLAFYGLANIAVAAAVAASLLAMRRRRQRLPGPVLLLLWFAGTTFVLHALVSAYAAYTVLIVPALGVVVLYGIRLGAAGRGKAETGAVVGEPVAA
jgi:4-amino-4-deoxy-L-arabinose transferase-like glycosyltransferase